MSRGTIILIVVLCAALAALLALPKLKSGSGTATATNTAAVAAAALQNPKAVPAPAPLSPIGNSAHAPVVTTQPPTVAAAATNRNPTIIHTDDTAANSVEEPPQKPLPTLERDYMATTNRDDRLDIMMDIAEQPSADAVKALTRLFQSEMDTDLKVDLLDSLLGIDGFKEEKLIMLTLGTAQGLPSEVRQSAIDGLIDLEDNRAIALLNGLLNDPDAEIRQSAQDAIELLQTPPVQIPVKLK